MALNERLDRNRVPDTPEARAWKGRGKIHLDGVDRGHELCMEMAATHGSLTRPYHTSGNRGKGPAASDKGAVSDKGPGKGKRPMPRRAPWATPEEEEAEEADNELGKGGGGVGQFDPRRIPERWTQMYNEAGGELGTGLSLADFINHLRLTGPQPKPPDQAQPDQPKRTDRPPEPTLPPRKRSDKPAPWDRESEMEVDEEGAYDEGRAPGPPPPPDGPKPSVSQQWLNMNAPDKQLQPMPKAGPSPSDLSHLSDTASASASTTDPATHSMLSQLMSQVALMQQQLQAQGGRASGNKNDCSLIKIPIIVIYYFYNIMMICQSLID